jgi:hypothetical protein
MKSSAINVQEGQEQFSVGKEIIVLPATNISPKAIKKS